MPFRRMIMSQPNCGSNAATEAAKKPTGIQCRARSRSCRSDISPRSNAVSTSVDCSYRQFRQDDVQPAIDTTDDMISVIFGVQRAMEFNKTPLNMRLAWPWT
mmetsp:Transcript_27488/g.77071  ORF Transcript_27488/g.77071 Transcript_27488/m.77071 type:complete len:102 (+) Transcript_27488:298-603(+)